MQSKLDALKIAIGSRIKVARKAAGSSQEDLAHAIGRTTAALSNIERGVSLPPLDTLLQIADVLDVPLSALIADLNETEVNRKRAELEANMASELRTLEDDQMAIALRLVRALRGANVGQR